MGRSAPRWAKYPRSLPKKHRRKLYMVKHVNHNDIGKRFCSEREILRIGNTVKPRRKLNICREYIP